MSYQPQFGLGELPGVWDESDLSGGEADSQALDTVQVPTRGRYVVHDGKVFRVQSMWIETRSTEMLRLGAVIYKDELGAKR